MRNEDINNLHFGERHKKGYIFYALISSEKKNQILNPKRTERAICQWRRVDAIITQAHA